MAVTSGTVYTNAVASELNTRFRVDWTQTSQSTASNTTTIHYKIYFENHWEYARNAIKVKSLKIDGTTVYGEHTWSNMSYQTVLLDEGDATIAHNSDGTKTFNLELNCWLYSNTNLTGNADFVLTSIPRYTTVSHSVSSYTETSITVAWTAGNTVDYVWYKLGSGSWVAVGSVNSTSGSYTISGLSEGTTYTIYTRVRRKDSQLSTDSSALTQKTATYPLPSVSQSVSSATETSITMAWSSDSTCDYVWYKLGSGSWVAVGSVNASSGSYTISGLSVGTSYTIYTRLRRKTGQKTNDSSALTRATYAYPYATSMPNFTLGNQVTITIYNPLSRSVNVGIRSASGNILTNIATTGTSVKGFDDATSVDGLYAAIPSATSGTYRITVTYGSNADTRTGGTFSVNQTVCKPTLGDFTYYDTETDSAPTAQSVIQNTAILCRNKSIPRYTVTNVATYKSATVSSVKVAVSGATYTMSVSSGTGTVNGGAIDSSSNVTATVTLTDSRGFTASKNVTVRIADWINPSAITTLKRRNGFYTETYLKVDASYSSLNNHNAVTITYSASASGETTITGTLTDNVQVTVQCANTKSWNFSFTITDSLGKSITYTRVLPRGIPLMFWDRVKDAVGVGRYPHKHALEVDRAMAVRGDQWGTNVTASTFSDMDTAGWYTILEYTGTEGNVRGTGALIADIKIGRSYTYSNNEVHEITLMCAYDRIFFCNEKSYSNYKGITQIRYVRSGTLAKVQIWYSLSQTNGVAISFNLSCNTHEITIPDPYIDTGSYTEMSRYYFTSPVSATSPVSVATAVQSFDDVNHRQSSADLDTVTNDMFVWFKATASMTTHKPPSDGKILHFAWDNSSPNWASQLFLGHGTEPSMFIRGRSDTGWGEWARVFDENHRIDASNWMFNASPVVDHIDDFNSANLGIGYWDTASTNRPSDSYGVCFSFCYNIGTPSSRWWYQIAFGTSGTNQHRRKINANAWTAWTAL